MLNNQIFQQKLQAAFNPPDRKTLLEARIEILQSPSVNADQRRERLEIYSKSINAADMFLTKHPTSGKNSTMNVTPPLSTGLPSGIDPEAVKDPKLRAVYEAKIKENMKLSKSENERNAIERFSRGTLG